MQKKNPIPPTRFPGVSTASFMWTILTFLRGILEQASAAKGQRDAVTQEIGDFNSGLSATQS